MERLVQTPCLAPASGTPQVRLLLCFQPRHGPWHADRPQGYWGALSQLPSRLVHRQSDHDNGKQYERDSRPSVLCLQGCSSHTQAWQSC